MVPTHSNGCRGFLDMLMLANAYVLVLHGMLGQRRKPMLL